MKISNIKRILPVVFAAVFCLLLPSCGSAEKYTEHSFDYFDTVTTIVGYADSEEEFDSVCESIKSELEEYHKLYNIYSKYEGINNLCTVNEVRGGVHAEVKVDEKIVALLLYAKEMYELTDGEMNVAMGSVLRIWHEYRERGTESADTAALPPMTELISAAEHCDINDVVVDEEKNTVLLTDPEMYLDVGAVAKGYAAEQVARMLEASGISGYVLNIGGNVRTVGGTGDGDMWTVGIENPHTDDSDKPYTATVKLAGESLVTSGSYQRYYIVNGKEYHHIIDPDTLMPSEGFEAVSVICSDSAMGDALSTALFSMSYEKGSSLVESLDGVEALWVRTDGEVLYSSSFEDYMS